ncbi:methyltransferase [Bordetella genomosp. 10]|uniref:Putative 4-hydroxy-4-methyl-2-oxoglutarate aldolase n=1 Tax=Bordetella genomosp. 10 TaxID=1416804 RepID=A0A261SD14_9BORD|nr:RraA family protein [Bordetella genomosp. 10]OZI34872.1 methyltransferase [Bordetella genomosp. 10]
MSAGFQVLKRKRAVDAETTAKFAAVPVANISDSMHRIVAGGPRLRPLHKGGVLAGPALTVKVRPGDNLMVHMALNLGVEGDVIVVDAGGDLTNAIIGERMIAYCVAKKFAGIVINGAVRDLAWIREHDFPVYAAGITHRGPYKDGPGEINVPVAFDGLVIEPGDLVVGDDDGLLCIPYDATKDVLVKAQAKHKQESDTFADIGKGDNNRAYYEKQLRDKGCYFEA